MEILVGTNDLTKRGEYYKVENYKVHDRYNKPQFAYNIAVIKVKDKIKFSAKVQPIEWKREEVPADVEATYTGWSGSRVSLTRFCYFRRLEFSIQNQFDSIARWHKINISPGHSTI